MSVKKYCYCENNCKYETLSKEEILAAIANAIETGTVGDCDTGFITTIKTINGQPLKFFVGTQSEYAALTVSQKQNLFAIITDDTTKEGILAAINELAEDVEALKIWREKIELGEIAVPKANKATSATSASEATKARQDSYGEFFKQRYLNIPTSNSRGYVSGKPINGLRILVADDGIGTFYHARLRSSSNNDFYDFGIIYANCNGDDPIFSPTVTIPYANNVLVGLQLVITPEDEWIGDHRYFNVNVYCYNYATGEKFTDSNNELYRSSTIEMRGLNGEFFIGE